jgi:hypothetical protein
MRKATEGYVKNTRNVAAYTNPILKEWVESADMGVILKQLSLEDTANYSHKINFDSEDVAVLESASVGMQTVCNYIQQVWNVKVSGHTAKPLSDPQAYTVVTKSRDGNEDTAKEYFGIQLSKPRVKKVSKDTEAVEAKDTTEKVVTKAKSRRSANKKVSNK